MKKIIVPTLVATIVILSFFAFRPANEAETKDYVVVIHDFTTHKLYIGYSDGRTEEKDVAKKDYEERAFDLANAFKQISAQGYELKTAHGATRYHYVFEK